MSKLYKKAVKNEWNLIKKRGFRMACCGCSLVHEFDFKIEGNKLFIRGRRNNRATGQLRRHRKHPKE